MKTLLIIAGLFSCIAFDTMAASVPRNSKEIDLEQTTSFIPDPILNGNQTDPLNTGQCISRPCQNGGVCYYYGSYCYVCACRTGYTGRNCQHKACIKIPYVPSFLNPFYKKCEEKAHVCVLDSLIAKCKCFDPNVCR